MSSPSLNTRIQVLKTRAGQTAGGGTRSSSTVRQPTNFAAGLPAGPGGQSYERGNENSAINFYQNAAREGVNAIGQGLAFDFRRELGAYLGGLNSIGALRSGAVESGADDIMRTYGDRVGAAASQATLGAIGYGRETAESEFERQRAAGDRKQQNKSGLWGAVGALGGAAIGKWMS